MRKCVWPRVLWCCYQQKGKFFGLRLHLTTTPDQLIDEWLLAPASVPDGKAVDALLEGCNDLAVIGDKAYNDEELEDRLWRKRRIHCYLYVKATK